MRPSFKTTLFDFRVTYLINSMFEHIQNLKIQSLTFWML
jgi:hypothetical protein